MAYEIPELSEPILESELTPKLRTKFRALFQEVLELIMDNTRNNLAREHAAATLHQTIQTELTAHPILARAVSQDYRNEWVLLEILFYDVGSICCETIKFLIDVNPHALLRVKDDEYSDDDDIRPADDALVHRIASSNWGCTLLPWIAQRYMWVFQHETCQNNPPHTVLIRNYVDGYCDLETVRRFYEIYPQGLREKRLPNFAMYPLNLSITGQMEPDADFFIWMALQFPGAIDVYPRTMMHSVCNSLASKDEIHKCTPNTTKICRFLISEHPELIRKKDADGYLPIHGLAESLNRPLVQEMVILLLKAYPECIHDRVKYSRRFQELSTLPFIQRVHPLISQELHIDKEISLLTQVSRNLTRASVPDTLGGMASAASLLDSIAEVYRSWTDLRTNELSTQKQCVQERIVETCRLFEADDVSDESDDDDMDEDDINEDEEDLYEGLLDEDDYDFDDFDDDDSEDDDDDESIDGDRNVFGFEDTDESEQEESDEEEASVCDLEDYDDDDDDDDDEDDGDEDDEV